MYFGVFKNHEYGLANLNYGRGGGREVQFLNIYNFSRKWEENSPKGLLRLTPEINLNISTGTTRDHIKFQKSSEFQRVPPIFARRFSDPLSLKTNLQKDAEIEDECAKASVSAVCHSNSNLRVATSPPYW